MGVKIKQGIVKEGDKYRYLGTMLTEDWRSDTEIKIRIAKARKHLIKRRVDLVAV